jgi:hypothetical protein
VHSPGKRVKNPHKNRNSYPQIKDHPTILNKWLIEKELEFHSGSHIEDKDFN